MSFRKEEKLYLSVNYIKIKNLIKNLMEKAFIQKDIKYILKIQKIKCTRN